MARIVLVLLIAVTSAVPIFAGSDMAKVHEVVNGHTFTANLRGNEITVELIGVVTPDPDADQIEVKSFGVRAQVFLAKFLGNGWVYLEYEPNEPHESDDGKMRAYVYRGMDAAFVNERVVAEGFGVAYTKHAFLFRNDFLKAQNTAMLSNRGLWGEGSETASDWGTQSVSGQPLYLGEVYERNRRSRTWVNRWIDSWW